MDASRFAAYFVIAAVLCVVAALTWQFLAERWRSFRVRRRAAQAIEKQAKVVGLPLPDEYYRDYGRSESPRERFLAGREQANHRAAQVLAGNRVGSNVFAYTKAGGLMRKTIHQRAAMATQPPEVVQKRTHADAQGSLNDYTPTSLFEIQAVTDMAELERVTEHHVVEVPDPTDLSPGGGSFGGGGASGGWDDGNSAASDTSQSPE